MIGIPLGGMRGQGRVGRGLQIVAEQRFLGERDRPRAPRSHMRASRLNMLSYTRVYHMFNLFALSYRYSRLYGNS